MIHSEKSPLANQTVKLNSGDSFVVEDWWDRVSGKSWTVADGNPACLQYAFRSAGNLPMDDEVLYGKLDGCGVLVHISEVCVE